MISLPQSWQKSNFVYVENEVSLMHVNSSVRLLTVISNSCIPCNEILHLRDRNHIGRNPSNFHENPIYYYEIEVISDLQSMSGAGVTIGFISSNLNQSDVAVRSNFTPGYIRDTIGFHSNGCVLIHNNRTNKFHTGYGTHDKIGVGIEIGGESKVFFTCNSKVVFSINNFYKPNLYYYPAVGLDGMGTQIKANFGKEPFQFFHERIVNSIISNPNLHSRTVLTTNNNNNANNDDDDEDLQLAAELSLRENSTHVVEWTEKDFQEAEELISDLKDCIHSQVQPKHTIPTNKKTESEDFTLYILSMMDRIQMLQRKAVIAINNSLESELPQVLIALNEVLLETIETTNTVFSLPKSTTPIVQGHLTTSSTATATTTTTRGNHNNNEESREIEAISASNMTYILRRGTKQEIKNAVLEILKICTLKNHESQLSTIAMKNITDFLTAGLLSSLLSVFNKYNDWSEGELLICRAVALLILYETNLQVLWKNLIDILKSFHILLLKPEKMVSPVHLNSPAPSQTTTSSIPTSSRPNSGNYSIPSRPTSWSRVDKQSVPNYGESLSSSTDDHWVYVSANATVSSNSTSSSTSSNQEKSNRQLVADAIVRLSMLLNNACKNAAPGRLFDVFHAGNIDNNSISNISIDNRHSGSSTISQTSNHIILNEKIETELKISVDAILSLINLLCPESIADYTMRLNKETIDNNNNNKRSHSLVGSGSKSNPVPPVPLSLVIPPHRTANTRSFLNKLSLNRLPKGNHTHTLDRVHRLRSDSLYTVKKSSSSPNLCITAEPTDTDSEYVDVDIPLNGRMKSNSLAVPLENSHTSNTFGNTSPARTLQQNKFQAALLQQSDMDDITGNSSQSLHLAESQSESLLEFSIDGITVQCSIAICHLSQISCVRTNLVKSNALWLLVDWLDICAELWPTKQTSPTKTDHSNTLLKAVSYDLHNLSEQQRELYESIPFSTNTSPIKSQTKSDTLSDLVHHSCKAIAYLTGATTQGIDRNGNIVDSDFISSIADDASKYTVGWIDAQVIAVGVPATLTKLIHKTCADAYHLLKQIPHLDPDPESTGSTLMSYDTMENTLPINCGINISSTLHSLSMQPQNRSNLILAGTPHALCCLLVDAAGRGVHRHRFDSTPRNAVDIAKLEMLKQQEDEIEKYLAGIATITLNSLFDFLSDKIPSSPSPLSTNPAHNYSTAESVLQMICHSEVIIAIRSVLALRKGSARLAALRVVSILLSGQALTVPLLHEHGVVDALVVVACEAEEDHFDPTAVYSYELNAETIEYHTTQNTLSKPMTTRSISAGSRSSYMTPLTFAPSMDEKESILCEETLRACMSLAIICQFNIRYAKSLFEKGLFKIMLRIVRSQHTEIHHEALRCISAMCTVVSSFSLHGIIASLDGNYNTTTTSATTTPTLHHNIASTIESYPIQDPLSTTTTIPTTPTTSIPSSHHHHHKEIDSLHTQPPKNGNTAAQLQRDILRKSRAMLHEHANDFVQSLRVLTYALKSKDSAVQVTALQGLSCLAADDQLRVGIVEGPLSTIIHIIIDPFNDADVRAKAEEVLVNIGFRYGKKDLEVAGNDCQLLMDWFYMRRSLRPQALVIEIITHWINEQFLGMEESERRALQQFVSSFDCLTSTSVLDRRKIVDGSFAHHLECSILAVSHSISSNQLSLIDSQSLKINTTPTNDRDVLRKDNNYEDHQNYDNNYEIKENREHPLVAMKDLIGGFVSPSPPRPYLMHSVSEKYSTSTPAVSAVPVEGSVMNTVLDDFIMSFDAWQMLRQGKAAQLAEQWYSQQSTHSQSFGSLSSVGSSSSYLRTSDRDSPYVPPSQSSLSHYNSSHHSHDVAKRLPVMEVFLSYINVCSGRAQRKKILEEEERELHESAIGLAPTNMKRSVITSSSSSQLSSWNVNHGHGHPHSLSHHPTSQKDNYHKTNLLSDGGGGGLTTDHNLPMKVDELLELFYPSPLQRHFLKGLLFDSPFNYGIPHSESGSLRLSQRLDDDDSLPSSRLGQDLSKPDLGRYSTISSTTTSNSSTLFNVPNFSRAETFSGSSTSYDMTGSSSSGNINMISLPKPHRFRAILLPPRAYLSFKRVGRVIERILEEFRVRIPPPASPSPTTTINNLENNNNRKFSNSTLPNSDSPPLPIDIQSPLHKHPIPLLLPYLDDCGTREWALTFRDSTFEGEFHVTLLATLRKCPEICAINFVCKKPDKTLRLGNLAGNFPPTIRMASFVSSLSEDSLKEMCTLLRAQNVAFQTNGGNIGTRKGLQNLAIIGHDLEPYADRLVELLDPWRNCPAYTDLPYTKTSTKRSNSGKSPHSNTCPILGSPPLAAIGTKFWPEHQQPQYQPQFYPPPLNMPESVQFMNASVPYSLQPSYMDQSYGLLGSPSPSSSSFLYPPRLQHTPSRHTTSETGLTYLDLTNNHLHDVSCGNILRATSVGPLLGLELAHNKISRACKDSDFISACNYTLLSPCCQLRYLGLSNNGLTHDVLMTVLFCLRENKSLTSLDLSNNAISSSDEFNEAIRQSIRINKTLRKLDLSRNKINYSKGIRWGLMENHTLLFLNLDKNRYELLFNYLLYHFEKIVKMIFKEADAKEILEIQEMLRKNRAEFAEQCKQQERELQLLLQQQQKSPFPFSSTTTNLPEPSSANGTNINLDSSLSNSSLSLSVTPSEPLTPETKSRRAFTMPEGNGSLESFSSESHSLFASFERQSHSLSSELNDEAVGTLGEFGNETSIDIDIEEDMDHNISNTLLPVVTAVSTAGATAVAALSNLSTSIIDTNTEKKEIEEEEYAPDLTASIMTRKRPNSCAPRLEQVTLSTSTNPSSLTLLPPPLLPPSTTATSTTGKKEKKTEGNEKENKTQKENRLCVLFSAPLVWMDSKRTLHPLTTLDLLEEKSTITQVFKEAHRDIEVHFNFATFDTVTTALTLGYRALHYSGHGFPNGLACEDGSGALHNIRPQVLSDLCRAGTTKVDFVFVSTCYSEAAGKAFVAAGVPHVVCVDVNAQLLDTAANAFTRAFYLSLTFGNTVQVAFNVGREAVKSCPRIPNSVEEGKKFRLLPVGDTHNVPIFTANVISNWPPRRPLHISGYFHLGPPSADHLPSLPEDFVGRELGTYHTVSAILKKENRVIHLVGSEGIGKTEVAAAVARYISDRRLFVDGVFFVKLKGILTHKEFLDALQSALTTGSKEVASTLKALLLAAQKSQSFNSSTNSMPKTSFIRTSSSPTTATSSSNPLSPTGTISSITNNSITSPTQNDRLRTMTSSQYSLTMTAGIALISDRHEPIKRRQNSGAFSINSELSDTESESVFNEEMNPISHQEDLIIKCLSSMNSSQSAHILIILDHANTITSSMEKTNSDNFADFSMFLGRLLDRCINVKILTTTTELPRLNNMNSRRFVENTVTLSPLTLKSSLVLFAKLSPVFETDRDRNDFVEFLTPLNQGTFTIQSRGLSEVALRIFKVLEDGHPAKIIKRACDSDKRVLEQLVFEKTDGRYLMSEIPGLQRVYRDMSPNFVPLSSSP